MIHANRIVTVGEQESIIDRPIILYRGDREVEIEFTLVGNEFMFSEDGNVIKSVNASHGQLVLNTPSGEHMFSELAECHEGKVVFVVTKEMIDEFIEMGFYSFQIRLYDSAEMKSRVTIPPVMKGFDIRNPIAAEDETNVVDQGLVDYARIFKDQSNEELLTFDWTGAYNKTEWTHHDVITENKLNKIEDALYSINADAKKFDVEMRNTLNQVTKDADKYVKEHIAEVEADVEEFERNLNTDVQKFKIDTNAAMTAHKNEVSSQLADNTNYIEARKRNNIYRLNELGCIHGTFKSIKEVFPNVTLEEVRLLDSTATLENSHVWYIIQKIMNDNIDTPATVIIDNFYYVDKTIQLTKSKTIIGESNQQDLFNSSNNSVLYKINSGDLFSVEKYPANNLYMSDFGAVGEKRDETAGDFLSIKRSLNGFTLKRLNVRFFKNGIRKYSGHTVCGFIDNCKFAYFADNGIHLSHLGNDSQVNQVTISNCAVHQYNTQNVFKYINNRDQIINEEYGNCICISGSGNIIDNVFIEDGICGINLTGQYKKGITIKGVYSEMSNIADIYVPNTEYVNEQITLNSFKVIGTNYISRGIFIGDKKVENYEPKSVDQLEDGYYPQNNRLLVKNNFTEIKIKFKSTYNLSNSELIRTHFYRTYNEIDRITKTYNGIFKLAESFMPSDEGELGTDYNTIFFSSCDIKSVSLDDVNGTVTLYFYDSIKLNEFNNLGYFRAQTDFVNGSRSVIFTTDHTQINMDDNSLTMPYQYASYREHCQKGNDISGYLYTWKNTSLNMYTSNVSIANGLVKKYEGVNEYVYEITVNKESNGSRLRDHCNYTPDFYSFEFPTGMTISNIIIYKK